MKKIVFFGLIAFVVFLSGCFQAPEIGEKVGESIYCGDSEQCFVDSMNNCEKAYGSVYDQSTKYGLRLSFSILESEDSKCLVNYQVQRVNSITPEDDESPLRIVESTRALENKKMVCKLPYSNSGQIEDFKIVKTMQYCTGTLVDTINRFS